jgi:hypothetical protein
MGDIGASLAVIEFERGANGFSTNDAKPVPSTR